MLHLRLPNRNEVRNGHIEKISEVMGYPIKLKIKVEKIRQEVVEAKPKTYSNIKGKDGQTYVNKQQIFG